MQLNYFNKGKVGSLNSYSNNSQMNVLHFWGKPLVLIIISPSLFKMATLFRAIQHNYKVKHELIQRPGVAAIYT